MDVSCQLNFSAKARWFMTFGVPIAWTAFNRYSNVNFVV